MAGLVGLLSVLSALNAAGTGELNGDGKTGKPIDVGNSDVPRAVGTTGDIRAGVPNAVGNTDVFIAGITGVLKADGIKGVS